MFKTARTQATSALAQLEEPQIKAEDDQKRKKRKKEKGKKEFYICRFCQKPFNNAQALGGHMNGHSDGMVY